MIRWRCEWQNRWDKWYGKWRKWQNGWSERYNKWRKWQSRYACYIYFDFLCVNAFYNLRGRYLNFFFEKLRWLNENNFWLMDKYEMNGDPPPPKKKLKIAEKEKKCILVCVRKFKIFKAHHGSNIFFMSIYKIYEYALFSLIR